jgi:PleD family two-component response regulator
VASYPEQAADLESLIAAADQALFAAKKSGKDAVGSYRGE